MLFALQGSQTLLRTCVEQTQYLKINMMLHTLSGIFLPVNFHCRLSYISLMLLCLYSPNAQSHALKSACTLNILNTGSCTVVWTCKNTRHTRSTLENKTGREIKNSLSGFCLKKKKKKEKTEDKKTFTCDLMIWFHPHSYIYEYMTFTSDRPLKLNMKNQSLLFLNFTLNDQIQSTAFHFISEMQKCLQCTSRELQQLLRQVNQTSVSAFPSIHICLCKEFNTEKQMNKLTHLPVHKSCNQGPLSF